MVVRIEARYSCITSSHAPSRLSMTHGTYVLDVQPPPVDTHSAARHFAARSHLWASIQPHPLSDRKWYPEPMGGTHTIVMGDRGRLVIPSDVRRRAELSEGKSLILLELDDGIVILTREQLKARVRSSLRGESQPPPHA